MRKLLKSGALIYAAITSLVACGAAPDGELGAGEAEGVAEQAIIDGNDVPTGSKYAKATVSVDGGTGIIIGPRHVLTAVHFNAGTQSRVRFYNGALPTGVERGVIQRYARSGVLMEVLTDSSGKFADFEVLQLSSPIPSGQLVAKLPTTWPGNNVTMVQVGRGEHDGYENPERILRYRSTKSYSASNAEGHVLIEAAANNGDGGGPIYTSWGSTLLAHGVYAFNVFEWATHGKYTSTAAHFWSIAAAVGMKRFPNSNFPGNDLSSTDNVSEAECVSLCMVESLCNAYTLTTAVPNGTTTPIFGRCYLKSIGAGNIQQNGRFSGTKSTTGTCNPSDGFCRI